MTIKICHPELEAIIQRKMESGRFENLEDVIAEAFRSAELEESLIPPARSLAEVIAKAGELGVELDITRHSVADRPLEL